MGPTLEHCWHVCETTCFQNFIDRCTVCQAYWWGLAHSWQSNFGLYGFAEVEASCLCVYIEETINKYFQPPLIVYMVFQWYMVNHGLFNHHIFNKYFQPPFVSYWKTRKNPVIPWSPALCDSPWSAGDEMPSSSFSHVATSDVVGAMGHGLSWSGFFQSF